MDTHHVLEQRGISHAVRDARRAIDQAGEVALGIPARFHHQVQTLFPGGCRQHVTDLARAGEVVLERGGPVRLVEAHVFAGVIE